MAAAGPGPGPGLCPFCRRPFKRLRAHLPHCKAAPLAPAASPEPPAGPRSRSVRDVARSPDLRPQEAEEVAGKLRQGVRAVMEKHRATVGRDKEPRSRGAGSEPGPAPQRRKGAQSSPGSESRSRGAAGSGTGSPKGGKGRLKATKALQEAPESGESPGELARQEGRDKCPAGEERLDTGLGWKPPEPAAHPQSLRRALGLGGHGPGRCRSELGRLRGEPEPPGLALLHPPQSLPQSGTQSGTQSLPQSGPQALSQSGTQSGTQALPQALPQSLPQSLPQALPQAQPQSLPHPPQSQPQSLPHPPQSLPQALPQSLPQALPRASRSSATALEWFPALYPDYEGLRIFPGTRFHEDVRMAAETPQGGLAQGQPGPLSQRPLMEVRLGELHAWISTCNFSPRGLLGAAQRAWSSYCAKYIHVKQGGPAGISMLLAGYCLLSYGWNYQHLKRHRWRKYH